MMDFGGQNDDINMEMMAATIQQAEQMAAQMYLQASLDNVTSINLVIADKWVNLVENKRHWWWPFKRKSVNNATRFMSVLDFTASVLATYIDRWYQDTLKDPSGTRFEVIQNAYPDMGAEEYARIATNAMSGSFQYMFARLLASKISHSLDKAEAVGVADLAEEFLRTLNNEEPHE